MKRGFKIGGVIVGVLLLVYLVGWGMVFYHYWGHFPNKLDIIEYALWNGENPYGGVVLLSIWGVICYGIVKLQEFMRP